MPIPGEAARFVSATSLRGEPIGFDLAKATRYSMVLSEVGTVARLVRPGMVTPFFVAFIHHAAGGRWFAEGGYGASPEQLSPLRGELGDRIEMSPREVIDILSKASLPLTPELEAIRAEDDSPRPPVEDKETEERDKFVYENTMKGRKYDAIVRDLGKYPGWVKISTVTGVKKAAKRYAGRHNLPPVPPRQDKQE